MLSAVRTALLGAGAPAFTPASLYAGGKRGVLYDPADPASMFLNDTGSTPGSVGSLVGRMADLSGWSVHATQAMPSARPYLMADGNLRYLDGDGVDDCLSGLIGAFPQPFTMFVAFKYDVPGGGKDIIDIGSGGAAAGVNRGLICDRGNQIVQYAGSVANVQAQTLTTKIIVARFDGASSFSRINGVQVATNPGTGSPSTGSRITLLAINGGGSEYMDGRFYAGGAIAGNLSAGDTANLEAWLAARSG